jgi:hypothetical protein
MMQSYIWKMVHTRTSEEPLLNISNPPPDVGVVDKSHVAMHRLHHHVRPSALSNYRLTLHSSSGLWTQFRQTTGSTPLNQSSLCFTVQSIRKLCMPPSSYEAKQKPGGPPTRLHCQLIIKFYEASSASPNVNITYWRTSSTTS